MNNSIAVLILAAGKSKRMQSALPKVMHPLAGRPMLGHVLDTAQSLKPQKLAVVIGGDMGEVEDFISPIPAIVQNPPKGTGHAVSCAMDFLKGFSGPVLILYGDTPFIGQQSLLGLLDQILSGASVAVMGFYPQDPAQYGRLVLNQKGELESIIEYADCNDMQRTIAFCNAGLMAVDGKQLPNLLQDLKSGNAQGEHYLTDLVAIARGKGLRCAAIEVDESEVMGVNTRQQLADAERIMQKKLREKIMAGGVTLTDPNTVFFSYDTAIGPDSIVEPNVLFGPKVKIGKNAHIKAFSHITGAEIGDHASIGPFARLRPGTTLADDVHIGNFVEIKNTSLGQGVKAGHLTYLGDATVGKDVNIGAGTITCNYDGFEKHRTEIGADSFIGSGTVLVAPISIGKDAYIAAGSAIVENIAAGELGIARAKQSNKPGWVAQFRAKIQKLLGKKSA